ncbi:MAG: cell division protein FtsZ, partial [Flavobacteriales bacterium]
KLKSPNGIADLENEPAFERRNVKFDETQHSNDSNVSRYTLKEKKNNENDDEEKKTEIRKDNPYLHDKPD